MVKMENMNIFFGISGNDDARICADKNRALKEFQSPYLQSSKLISRSVRGSTACYFQPSILKLPEDFDMLVPGTGLGT